MKSVLLAESAILVHFKSVRIILLVLHCVVVALLAFCTSECDFNSHDGTSVLRKNFTGTRSGRPPSFGWIFGKFSRTNSKKSAQKKSLQKVKTFEEVKRLYHNPLKRSIVFFIFLFLVIIYGM